jgi:uncharacterized protein involved in exopolysaccharide biosynthesis
MPHEDLVPARESAPTPTLRELAMVLFRRRKVVICVSGLVLAAAVVYAFAGKKYEANMKVLVRRGRANAPATAEENRPAGSHTDGDHRRGIEFRGGVAQGR